MKPILKPRIVWSGLALLGLLLAAGGVSPAGGMTTAAGPATRFVKIYRGSGWDRARAVAGPLADRGFLLAGMSYSFEAGAYDMYAVRIDQNGNVLWSRTYGGSGEDVADAVAGPLADGGFLLVGYTRSFGAGQSDMYAVRIDQNGNVLWSKTYGGSGDDWAYAVAGPLADGGFLLVGGTQSFGAGSSDMYAVRIDQNGNILWSKTYGGSADDWAEDVVALPDGGFLLVGGTQSFGAGNGDMYAVRIDSSGNVLWSKTYGGSFYDWAHAVAGPLADGGFLLAGRTFSFGPSSQNMYAVRIDQNGNVRWSKAYGGSSTQAWAYAVAGPSSDGGFLLVGSRLFSSYDRDVYAVRIDGSGNVLWGQIYGGPYKEDDGYAVAGPLADGGFLLAGTRDLGYPLMYAVRIDGRGDSGCDMPYDPGNKPRPTETAAPTPTVNSPSPQVTNPSTTVNSPTTQTSALNTQTNTLCLLAPTYLYLPLVLRNR